MDNIEANNDNLTTLNSATIRYLEEIKLVSTYLVSSDKKEKPQTEHGQMKPEHDGHARNQEVGLRSEPMGLQREEISDLVHVQGTDPETGLTAHHDESSENHSSSSQTQSSKHNMPKFFAKNIKKLIKAYLKSTSETQGQQQLNHLYIDFVQNNLTDSLKSINSFCFTSALDIKTEKEAQNMDERFKEFLEKKLKRPEAIIECKQEWRKAVQICQDYFRGFLLHNQEELRELAQRRVFKERSKNDELVDYSERFLANMRNGTPRGKDVKSRRGTQ